jgi:alpha-tubulin suppressor-like RCC1 family protein
MKLLSIPFALCIAFLESSYHYPYLAAAASITNTTSISSSSSSSSSTHITSSSSPPCSDTSERFFVAEAMIPNKRKGCAWVARKKTSKRCRHSGVADMCPSTCGLCATSVDTVGMALGGFHACLMTADGLGVKCMGSNDGGQLGDGSNQDSASPVTVYGWGDVPLSIAAGGSHTCAILRNKSVQCFGSNGQGQLGNGSRVDSNLPVNVNLDAGDIPLSVAAGSDHTCILLQGNTVKCFGDNNYSQLGNESTFFYPDKESFSTVPVKVDIDAGDIPLSIAVGYRHTCMILQGNVVKCFGFNIAGQSGSSTFNIKPVKVDLDAGDIPLSIAAGGGHTCILLEGNTIKCFGVGNNISSYVPVKVDLDAGDIPLSVTAGGSYTCIILQGNTVKCFGTYNVGGYNDGLVKINLDAGDSPVSVAVGTSHTCIMLQGNTVKCFGSNFSGQLGRGFKSSSETEPQFVIGFGI